MINITAKIHSHNMYNDHYSSNEHAYLSVIDCIISGCG